MDITCLATDVYITVIIIYNTEGLVISFIQHKMLRMVMAVHH